MAGEFVVTIRGLESFDEFDAIIKRVPTALARSINRAAERARTRSSRNLRQEIAFKARDLVSANGKISLRPASRTSLQAQLSASSRPRSLARFSQTKTLRKKGVRVQVQPGSTRTLPGAFLLGFPAGDSDGVNTILAVRSPSKPRSAYKPRAIGKGLWSLYGPSVAQALLNAEGKGIWPAMEAEILENLETEFLRQLKLES